ncbi:MAG: Holliday junction resolvase RecU [Bacilli bacterium]|nr:Holliday junction resolvase RecU [Bacilli bacterium]
MNYPNGIKKHLDSNINHVNYGNRGMTLESELNDSNEFYRLENKAFIYKKPTPIKITKVDYPSRDKAIIKEAFFTVPSTTDYNGLYKGKYIDFEAKETQSSTSFTLRNIHPHQINHIKNIYENGGISFLIIRFTSINETYLLTAEKFLKFLEKENRKSIPIDYFKKEAYQIKDSYRPRIDYLKIVDGLIGGI